MNLLTLSLVNDPLNLEYNYFFGLTANNEGYLK